LYKIIQFIFFFALNSNNVTFILQAVIHLESIFPCEKRIEFLDSLVEKFVTPESSQGELASLVDKEEISSIFLEVKYLKASLNIIVSSWFGFGNIK
jgi:hypothetical protein